MLSAENNRWHSYQPCALSGLFPTAIGPARLPYAALRVLGKLMEHGGVKAIRKGLRPWILHT